jgi:hypothetical protein
MWGMGWIHLALDRGQCVKTVMNLWVPRNVWNFLSGSAALGVSRTLLHVVNWLVVLTYSSSPFTSLLAITYSGNIFQTQRSHMGFLNLSSITFYHVSHTECIIWAWSSILDPFCSLFGFRAIIPYIFHTSHCQTVQQLMPIYLLQNSLYIMSYYICILMMWHIEFLWYNTANFNTVTHGPFVSNG